MKAGNTNFEVNARVKIKNVTGEDSDLNGKTGRVTHPFPGLMAPGIDYSNWVGVRLDEPGNVINGIANVKASQVEPI